MDQLDPISADRNYKIPPEYDYPEFAEEFDRSRPAQLLLHAAAGLPEDIFERGVQDCNNKILDDLSSIKLWGKSKNLAYIQEKRWNAAVKYVADMRRGTSSFQLEVGITPRSHLDDNQAIKRIKNGYKEWPSELVHNLDMQWTIELKCTDSKTGSIIFFTPMSVAVFYGVRSDAQRFFGGNHEPTFVLKHTLTALFEYEDLTLDTSKEKSVIVGLDKFINYDEQHELYQEGKSHFHPGLLDCQASILNLPENFDDSAPFVQIVGGDVIQSNALDFRDYFAVITAVVKEIAPQIFDDVFDDTEETELLDIKKKLLHRLSATLPNHLDHRLGHQNRFLVGPDVG